MGSALTLAFAGAFDWEVCSVSQEGESAVAFLSLGVAFLPLEQPSQLCSGGHGSGLGWSKSSPLACARSFCGLSPPLLPSLGLVPLAGLSLFLRSAWLGGSQGWEALAPLRAGGGSLPRSPGRGWLCHSGGATRWQPWPGRGPAVARPAQARQVRADPPSTAEVGAGGWVQPPRACCEQWEPRGKAVVPGAGERGCRVQLPLLGSAVEASLVETAGELQLCLSPPPG